ncbi:hypothetical protein ACJMK2_037295 [Sinanodonta woodiana]|uniref:ER-bound oxygenase mpaB/mpaB'/Rubber oxygenase catalytic domain-containing protein n=1 Tax=Sinanodonta woodiana TaxID=1069815 RepID=A0ABD3WP46_SINWO
MLFSLVVEQHQQSPGCVAYRRYFQTYIHLLRWHYGNVFKPDSVAQKSIQLVRQIHNSVRENIMSDRCDNKIYVSQHDMAVVRGGFFGAIIMYPSRFGIHCSMADLDDYVYFWRWLGYCLGIKHEDNMCLSGYSLAYKLPALKDPPKDFPRMSSALAKAGQSIVSTEAVIAFKTEAFQNE